MTPHQSAAISTTPPLMANVTDTTRPTPQATVNALYLLPAHLLELVLQHVQLYEQLNHTTHLCKHFQPPTAITLRYATVPLNDDSVWHISRSPRLFTLLSAATAVDVQVDTIPQLSRALQFVLSAPNVDVLFPQLAHFGYHISWRFAEHSPGGRMSGGDEKDPLSVLPLLPFLSARHATLVSLHIAQYRLLTTPRAIIAELPRLLAPLTELRRLRVGWEALTADGLPLLLALPLHVLDLSTCTLWQETGGRPPPTVASVAECALLRSCRTLRLPSAVSHLPPPWLAFLEGLITQRTDSTRLQSIALHHKLSEAAIHKLVDLPPSRCLSLDLSEVVEANRRLFLTHAATSPRFLDMPPRHLRVSVHCTTWHQRINMAPFVSFVAAHHARLRSLILTHLPRLAVVTSSVLAVVLRCRNLRCLHLSASVVPRKRAVVGYEEEAQRAEQPRLHQLRTLKLEGLTDEHGDVSRLFSACPALRLCVLHMPDLSVAQLSTLATSCPLLSHLQLLGLTHRSLLFCPTARAAEEPRPQLPTPFRSLMRLDLHYNAQTRNTPAELPSFDAVLPLLIGSPLRRLALLVQAEALYQAAVMSLVVALPRLEKLTVMMAVAEWIADALSMETTWDDDGADEDAEEKQPMHITRPSLPMPSPPSTAPVPSPTEQPLSSSLLSLELLVISKMLPVEHLTALLAHCPAVTAFRLTIRDTSPYGIPEPHNVLVASLHCLASIGQHCPLIEHVVFQLHYTWRQAPTLAVLGVEQVRSVVDAYQLPERAFARLQRVRQVGGEYSEVLSSEAVEYVRRHWLSAVGGEAALDWHTAPSEAE